MKIRGDPFTVLFFSVALALIALSEMGKDTIYAAEPGRGVETQPLTIEVTIKNMSYLVKGYTLPGRLTSIVVRNDDQVTHGFYSPLFKEVPVRLEGDGYQITGKHGTSFRLDPGNTMTLHFISKGSVTAPLSVASMRSCAMSFGATSTRKLKESCSLSRLETRSAADDVKADASRKEVVYWGTQWRHEVLVEKILTRRRVKSSPIEEEKGDRP